jgi:2-methylcitrate dehydratase PrpD
VRLRAFEPSALNDPVLRELAGRVILCADDEMESSFPGQRRARVVVIDHAGQQHTAERHTRKGDPDDPLTDAELADKFADLVVPVLGETGTSRLSEALWALADATSVRGLPIRRADA